MKRFLPLTLALILYIPVGLFGGMVLADMWGWFITPVFTEFPTLTTLQAWGIMLVSSYLRTNVHMSLTYAKLSRLHPEASDAYDSVVSQISSAIVILVVWALSAFVKFFVM